MSNQKGFAPILVLVVGIIIWAGIYLFVTKDFCIQGFVYGPNDDRDCLTPTLSGILGLKQKPTSTPAGNIPNNEDLKDWKTYRNEEYGFETKYFSPDSSPHE